MGSNARVQFTPGQAFCAAACPLLMLALCVILLCCAACPFCFLMRARMHARTDSLSLMQHIRECCSDLNSRALNGRAVT